MHHMQQRTYTQQQLSSSTFTAGCRFRQFVPDRGRTMTSDIMISDIFIGITQTRDGFLYRTPEESNYPVVFCLFKKVLFIHSYFLCVFCSCKMSNMHLAIVRRDSLAFILLLLFGIHFGLVKSYM